MCGIAGIVNFEGFPAERLQRMNDTLRHRGPDDEGYWLHRQEDGRAYRGNDTVAPLSDLAHVQTADGLFQIGFAHRRLSILDLTPHGHQPLVSPSGNSVLAFNGEIYNYEEVATWLVAERGAPQRLISERSDSHVLHFLLQHEGLSSLPLLRGMFAFAWLDLESGQLHLVRDRYGIKPLYYTINEGGIAFASELKALLAAGLAPAEVEAKTLAEYLAYGTTTKPHRNLFAGIKDLKPGTILSYALQSGQRKSHTWYRAGAALPSVGKDPAGAFELALSLSIKEHLIADVPVGSCLSGGLDSGAIVSMVAKDNPDLTFHTITAAYDDPAIDESGAVKEVAQRYPNLQTHFTYPQAEDFLDDVDDLLYHQEQPIGSTSIYAQWAVMKEASAQGIKVLLDGQGADEILGGYYNFAGIYLISLLKQGKIGAYQKAMKALKHNFTPQMRTHFLRAAYYFLPKSIQQSIRARKRVGMQAITPEFQGLLNAASVPARGGRTFQSHSLLSLQYGLYDLLRYEDRNSMAFGIETRVPFLDHRVVELALALPDNVKIKDGWTKHVLRDVVENRLPKSIVHRKDKLGFVTPQADWKAKVLPSVRDYVREADLPALIDKSHILALCDRDLTENAHLSEFWRLFSVLKWMERFKVKVI